MDSAGELESMIAQLTQTVNECTGTQTYTHIHTQTHNVHTERPVSSFMADCRSLSDRNLSGPRSTYKKKPTTQTRCFDYSNCLFSQNECLGTKNKTKTRYSNIMTDIKLNRKK